MNKGIRQFFFRGLAMPVFMISIFIAGCKKESCLTTKGNTVHVERNIDVFRTIKVDDIFEIYFEKDTVTKIEIIGGENLVENTNIYVHDSTLYLYDKNKCKWLRDYEKLKVIIHYNSDFHQITAYSPSYFGTINPIESSDLMITVAARLAEFDLELNCYKFYFYTHGITGGIYRFKGNVEICDLHGYNSAKIIADSLFCTYNTVYNYSIADFYVRASSILNAGTYSKGNIYYYGDPIVNVDEQSSKGKIFPGY